MLPLGLVRVSHPRGRRRRAAARGAVPPPPILRQAAAFHRTARREVWPLIGVAVIVGAVAVRYVMRAHRRVQLEEQGQNPDDEDEVAQGGGTADAARCFPVLGVDVGTLQACVAVASAKAALPAVVENHEGRRTTPAFLAYEDSHVVVGQLAKRGRWRDPTRVAYDTQRLLGLPYDDKLRPLFPFRLAELVEVVEDAVAALVAAKYSGAMGKHRGEADDDHFDRPWVVVDVGGLLTQVSVVSLCAERGLAVRKHEVVEGLGGEQLDAALVRQLVTDFKAKYGVDLGMDYLALERLYDAAESAKLELSSKLSAAVSLPFITADHTGPKHLDARLTRAQYQALCDPLVSRLKEPYDRVLQQSNLLTTDLQGVLLTGGTSRLPFVRDLVARLAGRPPLVLENPEEAAALGGAYFGREIM